MNALLPRFLKSAYRKEPIITTLLTIGVVDAIIGGFDDSWSLFVFGLGTAGFALIYKLWRMPDSDTFPEEQVVQRYLPPQSSNSALPIITVAKKNSRP
jgi:hypothetical protein